MDTLTCYCAGGLANRVRPLAAYKTLADDFGREFSFFWAPDQTCGASFGYLFRTPFIEAFSISNLPNVGSTIYSKKNSYDNTLYCQPAYFGPFSQGKTRKEISIEEIYRVNEENVTIIDNYPKFQNLYQYLFVINQIFQNNKAEQDHSDFSRTLGLHVRLTDFRRDSVIGKDYYSTEIARAWETVRRRGYHKQLDSVYVASDEEAAAEIVREIIPLPIVDRPQFAMPSRLSPDGGDWRTFDRNASSVKAAVQDIVALSNCAFRIGLRQSTFFCLARELALSKLVLESGSPRNAFRLADLDHGFERKLLHLVNAEFQKYGAPADIFLPLPKTSGLTRLYKGIARLPQQALGWIWQER